MAEGDFSSPPFSAGNPAPDDCVDVGMQSGYDTLKSVPTHPAGYRAGQSPIQGSDASGYASGGNPLKQGEGSSGNG